MAEDQERYISKVPSSAFLSFVPKDAHEGFVDTVTLTVDRASELKFMAECRKLAAEPHLHAPVHFLNSMDTPKEWMVLESAGPSGGHANGTSLGAKANGTNGSANGHGHANGVTHGPGARIPGFLTRVAKMLEKPESVGRKTVIIPANVVPCAIEKSPVLFEEIKVVSGQAETFVEATKDLAVLLETGETSQTGNEKFVGQTRRGAVEGMRVGLQLLRDQADKNLFTLLLHAVKPKDVTAFRASPVWGQWLTKVSPLLDGSARSTLRYRTTFHSETCKGYSEAEPPTEAPVSPIPESVGAGSLRSALPDLDLHPRDRLTSVGGAGDLAGASGLDSKSVVLLDKKLGDYLDDIQRWYASYRATREAITQEYGGSLRQFSTGHTEFGLHVSDGAITFREWLPSALEVYLIGEFNAWDRTRHPLTLKAPKGAATRKDKDGGEGISSGIWELELPNSGSLPAITHGTKFKMTVKTEGGDVFDRVPAWTRLAWKSEDSNIFDGVCWNPPASERYTMRHPRPQKPEVLKLYEAHIGTCGADAKVSTYREFWETVLPRVRRLGYNAVLLLGIQEHSEYSTAGRDVTSFFAPSSRFGTPEELKELVDRAHGMGLSVLFESVVSHASLSTLDGLANLDGSDPGVGFFDKGAMNQSSFHHGKCFDYSNPQVLRFLLSNLRYYMDEFGADGFRFAHVTAMLYKHRGVGRHWDLVDPFNPASSYRQYFDFDVYTPGVTFVQLANDLVHSLSPDAITIAEDHSGHPLTCVPIAQGGFGFDFRQNIGYPGALLKMLRRGECGSGLDLRLMVDCLARRSVNDRPLVCMESFDQVVNRKRPLKVAMFAWESLYTHPVGGVAPHVTELAAALARLGHEPHVFVRSTGAEASHTVHYGVHYHQCTFNLSSDFVGEMSSMCNAFVYYMEQQEMAQGEHFQICHSHDWLAAKALVSAKAMGRMCVMTMHSTEFGRCGNNAWGGQSARIRDIEAEACHVSDRVICVSGVLAEEVIHQYGIHPDKIKVIYNGIHCENFDGVEVNPGEIKEKYGIGPMDPTFLFVGRMAVQKGPDLLVDAIPMILQARGDAKFLIVGDGHMKDDLAARMAHYSGSVKFLGAKKGWEVRSLFKACDAVVVPSRNEPFGIVVLESWAAHKPVVATTSGGPRDFVSHDGDGYLVDPTPGSIAWGCCKVMENFAHAQWMGQRGRVKAAFSFSWDTIAEDTRNVYWQQLNKLDCPVGVTHEGDYSVSQGILGLHQADHMGVFDSHVPVRHGMALINTLKIATLAVGGAVIRWADPISRPYTDDGKVLSEEAMMQSDVNARGGAAWMNAAGSEFGHPDGIDFPRAGNGFSYENARRKWELSGDKGLKYKHLELFDAVLVRMDALLKISQDPYASVGLLHGTDQLLAVERQGCLIVMNFSWNEYKDYRVFTTIPLEQQLKVALSTGETRFGATGDCSVTKHEAVTTAGEAPTSLHTHAVFVDLAPKSAMILAPNSAVSKLKGDPVLLMDADAFIDARAKFLQ